MEVCVCVCVCGGGGGGINTLCPAIWKYIFEWKSLYFELNFWSLIQLVLRQYWFRVQY